MPRKRAPVIRPLSEQAGSSMRGSEVSLTSEAPNIIVPKLGISLDATVQLARAVLGLKTSHIISGEFIERDKRLWLRLRRDGLEFYPAPEGVDPSRPDDATDRAALAVLGDTWPYIVSAYYYARGEPDEARLLASRTVYAARTVYGMPKGDRNAKWSHNLIGVEHRQRQYEQAKEAFLNALDKDGSFKEARNNLGNLYLHLREIQKGVEQYELAIQSDPGFALAHYNLCAALSESDIDRLLSECRTAFGLGLRVPAHITIEQTRADEDGIKEPFVMEPGEGPATPNIMLGNFLAGRHRWGNAEQQYREAISHDPGNAAAHNNLGVVLFSAGRLDDAAKEFRHGINDDPNLLSPRLGLANLLRHQNKWE